MNTSLWKEVEEVSYIMEESKIKSLMLILEQLVEVTDRLYWF